MSSTLSFEVAGGANWSLVETTTDGSVRDNSSSSFDIGWTPGTGAGQCDKLWHNLRTLAASTPETLDLTNLTTSIFGTNVTANFAHVKGIQIINQNAVSGDDLTVGAAGSNPFLGPMAGTTPTQLCKAGGVLLWDDPLGAGWSTSSANNLKINNGSSHSITYEIVVWGTSV